MEGYDWSGKTFALLLAQCEFATGCPQPRLPGNFHRDLAMKLCFATYIEAQAFILDFPRRPIHHPPSSANTNFPTRILSKRRRQIHNRRIILRPFLVCDSDRSISGRTSHAHDIANQLRRSHRIVVNLSPRLVLGHASDALVPKLMELHCA